MNPIKTTSHERLRKNPRAILGAPVLVEHSKQDFNESLLIDVSISGAKIKTNMEFGADKTQKSIVVLWSVVPGIHPLKLHGKILWKDKKHNLIGVQWENLSIFSRKIIQRVVYFHRS